MSDSAIPWTAAHLVFLSITNSQSLLKLTSIESVMPSSHLILCCSLILLLSVFPRIRVFSKESVLCIRWPKYWSSSFSISPSNEYSGLISFRMDWLDLLAVQGTLKSLLQHHSSKASILQCSAFFMVQLSHPYTTTGKAITLTGRTFVGNVMFLLFNMQSSLVIAFLPRSKRLLISWLIIRSLQLHAVHSKTYHCQLAALMVTVSGLWASVMAGAHISANMHLCSSKGSPASVFMYILRKEGKKKKIQKRKGHGDDEMSSEEFGGKAIMSADG